ELPGPVTARKGPGFLWIEWGAARHPLEVRLQVPGEVQLPGSELAIEARRMTGGRGAPGSEWICLAWKALRPPLTVRTRRAGDRLTTAAPKGPGTRTYKLKELVGRMDIPRWQRDRLVVLADRDGLVWVAGLGPAERARPHPTTDEFLCLRFKRARAEALGEGRRCHPFLSMI
ncbi:MAG TPA: tRNA lysidine(34) synthetase TilS, partial [Limnochordia bacterium]